MGCFSGNSTFIGATIYMLIVQYWSRNVTAKWDNLHKSKEQVASLCCGAAMRSLPLCQQTVASENTKLNTYQNARRKVPKVPSTSTSTAFLSRCLLSLRWLCRIPIGGSIGPPSHKSSTRKAWTVYLSGIPTQATSWPKHMITKTPQRDG